MLLSDRPPGVQLGVLSSALQAQRPVLDVYDDYYSGAVPFHLTEARYAEVYRRMQREARPKWAKLIVLAASQRLAVEGFLTQGAPEPDQAVWESFVNTGLDLSQHEVHLDAVRFGRAYVSAWPQPDGSVRCIPESPYETIHWRSPDRTRYIVLKMWAEEDVWRAILFTQEAIYAWRAERKQDNIDYTESANASNVARGERPYFRRQLEEQVSRRLAWEPDGDAIPNPFYPYMPVVPFVAGSAMTDVLGRSDLESALDILDRIMALQVDLLLVSKVMGFPVRWASGIEVPLNANGEPANSPFTTSIERFLTTDNPDARFGQLPAADLRQIESVIGATVTELAATTETPSSVLATANLANPVSAEALRAQEIPLVHRVRRHQRSFGPAWVAVARLLAKTLDGSIEVAWADPEVHSEAALTDALVKQVVSLNVPYKAAWEMLPGATPATVARWEMMRAAQLMEERIALALAQPAPVGSAPPAAPVGPAPEEVPSGTP